MANRITRTSVGPTSRIPSDFYVLTHKDLRGALMFDTAMPAFLSSNDEMIPERYDMVFLAGLFSVVYYNMVHDIDYVAPLRPGRMSEVTNDMTDKDIEVLREEKLMSYKTRIYLPDWLRYVCANHGSSASIAQYDGYANKFLEHLELKGNIDVKTDDGLKLRQYSLFDNFEYEKDLHCVSFVSPYFNKLAEYALRDRSRVLRRGNKVIYNADGEPVALPPVTTLIKPSLISAPGKLGAEMAMGLVILLVVRGKGEAHIKGETLIERCPKLQATLANMKARSKNTYLKRTTKLCELYVREHTNIYELYADVHLDMPKLTTSTLGNVITISARGKYKNPIKKEMVESFVDVETKDEMLGILSCTNGVEFEKLCAELLFKVGFHDITETPASGDRGADLIAYKDDVKYVIQCKGWKATIGNKAIQEVYSAKGLYEADVAVVMTNSVFTEQAITDAKQLRVRLWDKNKLIEMNKESISV